MIFLMARYLIVESRDPREYRGSAYILTLAGKLKDMGHDVTVYLIENGVLAAKNGSKAGKALFDLSTRGVKLLAEDVSLKARGIGQIVQGVTTSTIDQLADLLVDGCDKVIWH